MLTISSLLSTLIIIVSALLAMAYLTLLERKLLAYIQRRKGPNKVTLIGITQPLADAMKLFLKERIQPNKANPTTYMIAPIVALTLSLLIWSIFPNNFNPMIAPFTIILFLCLSSMNVYPTLMAGWTSNSKYALMGSLRSVAQTISYEVSMTLLLLTILIISHTFNFTDMITNNVSWPLMMMPMVSVMWFISILAETNRAPFDFAEGESELVSGFNTEYGSGTFALIFMAEYANIVVMSLLTAIIFTPHAGVSPITSTITLIVSSLFVIIRGTLPRIRYDQLMELTWKFFLPFVLAILMIQIPYMIMI